MEAKEENGVAEDGEEVRWYYRIGSGHEFEQIAGESGERGACVNTVHGATKSWTPLSD